MFFGRVVHPFNVCLKQLYMLRYKFWVFFITALTQLFIQLEEAFLLKVAQEAIHNAAELSFICDTTLFYRTKQ